MGGARASLSLVYYLKTNSRDLVMAPMSGALLTFIQSTCFILSMRSFPKHVNPQFTPGKRSKPKICMPYA